MAWGKGSGPISLWFRTFLIGWRELGPVKKLVLVWLVAYKALHNLTPPYSSSAVSLNLKPQWNELVAEVSQAVPELRELQRFIGLSLPSSSSRCPLRVISPPSSRELSRPATVHTVIVWVSAAPLPPVLYFWKIKFYIFKTINAYLWQNSGLIKFWFYPCHTE